MRKFEMASGSPWKAFMTNVRECRAFNPSYDCNENNFGMHMHEVKPSKLLLQDDGVRKCERPKQVIVLGSITRNQQSVVRQAISWLSTLYETVIISEDFGCPADCLVSGKGDIAARLVNGKASDHKLHLLDAFDVFILPSYGKLVKKELLHLQQYPLGEVIISTGYQVFPGMYMLSILCHGKLLP